MCVPTRVPPQAAQEGGLSNAIPGVATGQLQPGLLYFTALSCHNVASPSSPLPWPASMQTLLGSTTHRRRLKKKGEAPGAVIAPLPTLGPPTELASSADSLKLPLPVLAKAGGGLPGEGLLTSTPVGWRETVRCRLSSSHPLAELHAGGEGEAQGLAGTGTHQRLRRRRQPTPEWSSSWARAAGSGRLNSFRDAPAARETSGKRGGSGFKPKQDKREQRLTSPPAAGARRGR